MKIIVDQAIPYIQGRFPEGTELLFIPGKDITPADIDDAEAMVVRTRTLCNESLLKNSKIKIIVTATIGTDHIDIPWCESHGITVRNAPGCNAPGVAQYVFASLFKIGFDPEKDTLGIIGYGHVGSLVADWAKTMGVKILVNDPPRKKSGKKDIEYHSLEYVLKNSDAVTLHVPFISEGDDATSHLIGKKEMDLMKPGAVLVNSSRGGVVDEKAFKEFLSSGKLRGIVDVWENEPHIDPELVKLVDISTPHIAGYSTEGKKRATRMALEALREEAGIESDISGLECMPDKRRKISRTLIENSYDPFSDTRDLKSDITRFEELRNQYEYRHEPLFYTEL